MPDSHYRCEGCNATMGESEFLRWRVCLSCQRARQAAEAAGGRCVCLLEQRRPHVCTDGFRSWMRCDRCLGTVDWRT